jgi:hypothetical protein
VLRRIADELVRLQPSRVDPHAYMVHELRRLARGLDQVVPRAPVPR